MTAIYLRNFDPIDDRIVARQKRAREVLLDGTNFPISGRAFAVGDKAYAFYFGYVPDYVSSPTVDILWTQTGAGATGNVQWNCAFACISPGDATRLADKAFATDNTQTTAASGDQILNKSTVTMTNTDSIAAGDLVIVRISREASVVTCGGTAVVLGLSINYTGT